MPDTNSKPVHNFKDLTGQRFGRWTVIDRTDDSRTGRTRWLCHCECGAEKNVQASSLLCGDSKSCGCFNLEQIRTNSITHGGCNTQEYGIWCAMLRRCYNPAVREFPRYGGRGITVCPRWLHSFENFIRDMGPRPSAEHSIDRIKNEGPYSPRNCRWTDRFTQANNKRNNRMVLVEGHHVTLAEASRSTGIEYHVVFKRLRRGWSIERALSTPVRHRSAITPG